MEGDVQQLQSTITTYQCFSPEGSCAIELRDRTQLVVVAGERNPPLSTSFAKCSSFLNSSGKVVFGVSVYEENKVMPASFIFAFFASTLVIFVPYELVRVTINGKIILSNFPSKGNFS